MGIFSRFTEIINANINAMLDKAEDPEKMVRLMIHEMEDTLTEVKSSAAEVVADRFRLEREMKHHHSRVQDWESKAQLALNKGREDLAKGALEQKLVATQKLQSLQDRMKEVEHLVAQYQADIQNLEAKLASARERQRTLVASHKSAVNRRKVEEKIYRLNTTGAFAKFEAYERRIDRYNAEAEIHSVANQSLEAKFQELSHNDDVEVELQALKQRMGMNPPPPAPAKPEKASSEDSAEEEAIQPAGSSVN